MDKEESRLMEARLATLERHVDFLMHINGLDLSALRTAPDAELLKYYQDAVQLLGLSAQQVPPEVISRWAELFLQLSEVEFVRLQNIVDYDHTWEPFYHLCLRLMTAVRQSRSLSRDVGMQHLYASLDRGRRNLRDSAILNIRKYPDTLPKKAKILLQDDDLAKPL
jgi:hypothetical protein